MNVFCIPGIIFLFCALVLNFLVSVSLPFLAGVDIARTTFEPPVDGADGVRQVRFGIWSNCKYFGDEVNAVCASSGHGYEVTIQNPIDVNDSVTISSHWTRGLAVHPVATALTLIAFLLSFSTQFIGTLKSSFVSFLAALLTLIAFACDIALYAYVKVRMGLMDDVDASTTTGAGIWMTFAAFILLLLAGCTVCLIRRSDKKSYNRNSEVPSTITGTTATSQDPEKPGFLGKFQRRKSGTSHRSG